LSARPAPNLQGEPSRRTGDRQRERPQETALCADKGPCPPEARIDASTGRLDTLTGPRPRQPKRRRPEPIEKVSHRLYRLDPGLCRDRSIPPPKHIRPQRGGPGGPRSRHAEMCFAAFALRADRAGRNPRTA